MEGSAIYFDGKTAADIVVRLRLTPDALRFHGQDLNEQIWPLSDLEAVAPPHAGRPLRLCRAAMPGARLVLHDEIMGNAILKAAPQLRGGLRPGRMLRPLAWIAGGLVAIAVCGYVVVQLAPEGLARHLPQSWRERIGSQMEASIVETARPCTGKAGVSALAAMTARIAESGADIPPLAITVYDLPVMNAFAMPGDRIVITRELISRAASPEEVAGVLTHEIGHAANRHPEAQMVRIMGIQILINLITGGNSDTVTSMAGFAALLRYSRGAESEADDYANRIMIDAAIDPLGLRNFFRGLLKEERTQVTAGPFDALGSLLSTHPGTEERMNRIQPLPDGIAARPVLSEAQWKALKAICD